MNIKSASGFPTPKTVWVREQARCAHFVQAATRSQTAASKSVLFRDACSCRPGGDRRSLRSAVVVTTEAVTRSAACNRDSAILDARGARSLFSRILSNAAMTRSRAGCVMYGHHPKFRGRPQTISVKHTHACNFWRLGSGLNLKFGGQRPPLRPISAIDKILKTRAGFADRPL